MSKKAEEAAKLLVEAARTNRPLAGLPDSCKPASKEEAYAIQDAVMALRGTPAGWKASPSKPFSRSPIYLVEQSGAVLEASQFQGLGVEIEFGFRVTKDLPPRGSEYSQDEVFGAIELVPLIEILGSRFVDRKAVSPFEALADNASNGGYLIGNPVTDWTQTGFKTDKCELAIDGKVIQTAVGTHPLDNPAVIMVWLANELTARHGGLRKGQVVTTGALKGSSPIKAGQKAVGTWGNWGRAEVTFR